LKEVKARLNRSKKGRSRILDEYCGNTGYSRKYLIRKIWPGVDLRQKQRKKKKETYNGEVKAALASVWEIFNNCCGQRLKPILEVEVARLRKLGKLSLSDEVALKLKGISSATIDRKYKHQREVLHLSRTKGGAKPGSLLKQKIPIRLTEDGSGAPLRLFYLGGVYQYTEHHRGLLRLVGGRSHLGCLQGGLRGMGKARDQSLQALKAIRQRAPFEWEGLDSDNGGEFINDMLYKYLLVP